MSYLLVVGLLILYIIYDVNYLIRFIWIIGLARLSILFGINTKVTETTTISGIVTTQDADICIQHMNNARYLRELDIARFHYFALTGLYDIVKKAGGGVVQASNIRYRRAIPVLSRYRIETKLVWWDDKAIYLEQKFITTADNFVRTVAISKQFITKLNILDCMKEFPECAIRPELTDELKLWLDSIEASSKNLRKDN